MRSPLQHGVRVLHGHHAHAAAVLDPTRLQHRPRVVKAADAYLPALQRIEWTTLSCDLCSRARFNSCRSDRRCVNIKLIARL
jgi:hypothetical protein